MVVLSAGQLIEAVGAFGYDGNERTSGLANLHAIGVVVTPFGVMGTLAGIALTVTAALAARTGHLESRRLKLSIAIVVVVIVSFVGGGLIFGY